MTPLERMNQVVTLGRQERVAERQRLRDLVDRIIRERIDCRHLGRVY